VTTPVYGPNLDGSDPCATVNRVKYQLAIHVHAASAWAPHPVDDPDGTNRRDDGSLCSRYLHGSTNWQDRQSDYVVDGWSTTLVGGRLSRADHSEPSAAALAKAERSVVDAIAEWWANDPSAPRIMAAAEYNELDRQRDQADAAVFAATKALAATRDAFEELTAKTNRALKAFDHIIQLEEAAK
jgi:hypothetical protein